MESAGKGSVVKPLLALEREDVTGVLEFRAQGIATQIYCRAGEIVFATGGTLTETLGRMLIRSGRLTEDQVAAIIRKLTDTTVDGDNVKFGEVLVEYGFMTADELEIALCQQVKDKILGCVHRGEGDWRLARNDKRLEDIGNYVVRTRPCLIEGALFLPERRVETALQLDENRYPEIVAPENVVAAEFELTKGETAVLAELDGSSTMQFVLSKAPSDTMAPLIAALILGGGVDLKASPGKRQNDGRSVPPDFRTLRRAQASVDDTATALRPPVRRASIEMHSDPLVKAGLPPKRPSYSTLAVAVPPSQRKSSRLMLQPPSPDVQTRSREAFDRLKADLDGRKPASKRMRWPDPKDDKQRRLMAESAFHQGRMWLHAEEAERALPGLHRALELRPEEREYELYVKWAQMLVNDTFKEDGQRASIQALAAKLVRENRDCELGHSILGHCAHHDSNDDAALRFFARASMLDPKLVDAARLARLLSQRANGTDKTRPGTRPGSRPEIRATRRDRAGLDPSIDEIVPGLAAKPIFMSARIEPTPKPATGKPNEETSPNSHRTFDGVGPAPVAPVRPNSAPPPALRGPDPTDRSGPPKFDATVKSPDKSPPPAKMQGTMQLRGDGVSPPKVPSKPPPPLRTQQSPQMPMLQPTPSPVPVATPAAPPPVAMSSPAPPPMAMNSNGPPLLTMSSNGPPPLAPRPSGPPPPLPLGFPPTMPIPAMNPAIMAGMGVGTQPMAAPLTPPMQHHSPSMPPPGASMPPPAWTPSMQPPAAPQQAGASLQPPANPFAPYPSERNLPVGAPTSSSRSGSVETVYVPKKSSKAGIIIGLFLTLTVTGILAFVVGTRVLSPKDDGKIAETTASSALAIAVKTPPVPIQVASTSASATASATPDPVTTVTASATVTITKPTPSATDKTTGVIRVRPKGWGHRVFVDGVVAGQGGKDITVPCGAHRVKVGSSGKEGTTNVPCGGTVEVD